MHALLYTRLTLYLILEYGIAIPVEASLAPGKKRAHDLGPNYFTVVGEWDYFTAKATTASSSPATDDCPGAQIDL